ncbi:MAG: hypothetical protein AB8B54_12750 [Sphingorhabdus sp.]
MTISYFENHLVQDIVRTRLSHHPSIGNSPVLRICASDIPQYSPPFPESTTVFLQRIRAFEGLCPNQMEQCSDPYSPQYKLRAKAPKLDHQKYADWKSLNSVAAAYAIHWSRIRYIEAGARLSYYL